MKNKVVYMCVCVCVQLGSPSAMKELIHYFETHGRLLDREQISDDAAIAAQATRNASGFVSCIRFNGIPILPPVVSTWR